MKSPFYANVFQISSPFRLWLPLVPGVATRESRSAKRSPFEASQRWVRWATAFTHLPEGRWFRTAAQSGCKVYVDNRRHIYHYIYVYILYIQYIYIYTVCIYIYTSVNMIMSNSVYCIPANLYKLLRTCWDGSNGTGITASTLMCRWLSTLGPGSVQGSALCRIGSSFLSSKLSI